MSSEQTKGKMASKRLWDKGKDLDREIHEFTVGDDPVVDLSLVYFDCLASSAHARMLQKVGFLSEQEVSLLVGELGRIAAEAQAGEFHIPMELEDCHTAIETRLTEKLGEVGKKVHTGRSRNDQILVAMRLFLRSELLELATDLDAFFDVLSQRFDEAGTFVMPGYTHFQRAMPSSVGMWLHAYSEHVIDLFGEITRQLDGIDRNPLGVGSGFSSNLPLDRTETSTLLGFSRIQRSPIETQNSRGRYEQRTLRFCVDVLSVLEKLASDIVLFSTEEFGFFSLPEGLTTGSSIMPQKRNPDVAELLRGSASKVRAREMELSFLLAKLPSSYHRDFQFSKEPTIRGLAITKQCLNVAKKLVSELRFHPDKMAQALSVDLYSTYDAYLRVKNGMPFRDAYRESAKAIAENSLPLQTLQSEWSLVERQISEAMAASRVDRDSFLQGFRKDADRISRISEKLLKTK